jgi:hypothetical protein
MPCALLALLIVLLQLLLPAKASASTQTIAVYADGPDAHNVREAVIRAVGGHVDIAADKVYRAALARAGQKRPFGNELDAKTIKRIQKAAAAIGAEAVLVARTRRDKKSRSVSLIVVDVSDGPAPPRRARLDLKPSETDSHEIASALGDALDKYAPKEEPPPPPVASAPRQEPPAPPLESPPAPSVTPVQTPPAPATPVRQVATPAQLVAGSTFELALRADFYGRRFEYRNGISPTPSLYSKAQPVSFGVSGKVFPFAASRGALGDLGISGDYAAAPLRTIPSFYSLGLCVRIHPREDARAVLSACVGYAVASFPSVGPPNAELPAVTYRWLRPALDARVGFGPVSVLVATAFRGALDPAGISTRFYNPQGYGFDADLGAAIMFARRFEWRLVASYERSLFAFTPPQGATFARGDALDQRYGARGSLAVVF